MSSVRTLHRQILADDFDIIILSNYGGGTYREDFAEAIYWAYYGAPKAALKATVKMDEGYIEETVDSLRLSQNLLYKTYKKYFDD